MSARKGTGSTVPRYGAALLALLVAAPAAAQFGPGPRAMGLGGGLLGLARGYESVYWNPANLALPDAPTWSVGIVQPSAVAASVGPDLFDLDILADETPTLAEQAAFLDEIPVDGADLRGDVTIPWLSVSVGPIGVGFSTTALGSADVSRELVELFLDARDDGTLDTRRLGSYRVGDTGYRDALLSRLTAAYAVPLEVRGLPVTVGVGARLVFGHRLERGRLFEPAIQGDELLMSGLALRSTGGLGFGIDVGATVRPVDGLTVGLAIENVLQRMSWDEDVELRGGEFTSTELDEDGLDGVLDRFEAGPFDPDAAPLEAYTVGRVLLEEAYLPAVLRIGAGYVTGDTRVGATLSSTVGGGDLHTGWPSYLGLGVEQRLSVLTLRAGYANSLSGASALTGGLGLELGGVAFELAGARTLGSDDPAGSGPGLDGQRYADRLVAGSGIAVTLGFSIRGGGSTPTGHPGAGL